MILNLTAENYIAIEDDFKLILTYFDRNYVNGISARGRRAAVASRYILLNYGTSMRPQ